MSRRLTRYLTYLFGLIAVGSTLRSFRLNLSTARNLTVEFYDFGKQTSLSSSSGDDGGGGGRRGGRAGSPANYTSSPQFLELFPWEVDSVASPLPPVATAAAENDGDGIHLPPASGSGNNGSIATPPPPFAGGKCAFSQKECCLGSTSGGGRVKYSPESCVKGLGVYNNVRDQALLELGRTSHLIDDDVCDVCRIVDIILKHNLTLAFAGDSVNTQAFSGLECELRRRGFGVTTKVQKVKRRAGQFWRYGLGSLHTLSLSLPDGTERDAIRNYRLYLPDPDHNLTEITTMAGNDILVFNFGLHVIERGGDFRDRYEHKWMKPILQVLRQHNFTLLAHRETVAQHFDGPGGVYWFSNKSKNGTCYPMQNRTIGQWREPILRSVAQAAGYHVVTADETLGGGDVSNVPAISKAERNGVDMHSAPGNDELLVIPFYNFTVPLWNLHGVECTHYCSTPHLWLPIWRGLRLGLDRKFGLLKGREQQQQLGIIT